MSAVQTQYTVQGPLTQYAQPKFAKQPQPSPALLDYAGTKAATVAFTHGLATQVADNGMRVNAVAPGPVWTPLQMSGGQPQKKISDLGSSAPLKRPGQPAAATICLEPV